MEDSATIVRRLMELSVQAVYIGAESEPREKKRRAGSYIAFMWRQVPPKNKHRLPEEVREYWSAMARSYGRFVRAKAKRWGPTWKDMFEAIDQGALYASDYSFLSSIAHGQPDSQIPVFSRDTIRVYSHEFVPVLLSYSSKYYLAVAEQWNNVFAALDKEVFATLADEVVGR
jgi:hypothetical protein